MRAIARTLAPALTARLGVGARSPHGLRIIGHLKVIADGSRAFLGTYDETRLPAAATMSIEVNALPITDSDEATVRLADLIKASPASFPA